MFNKDDLERTLYTRVNSDVGSAMKKFAKAGAVGAALYAIPNAIGKMSAYGLTNADGNYVCDPQHLNLEKIQYKSLVDGMNAALHNYQSNFPDASNQQIHNIVMGGNNYNINGVDLMYKMQECLSSNGIDPNSVVEVSKEVTHAIAVPEFGPIAAAVTALSLFGGILASKYFGKFRNK